MKVYVVSVSQSSEVKDKQVGERIIKDAKYGVLRVFSSKEYAKQYIETFYKEVASQNASISTYEKKDGSSFTSSIFDCWDEPDNGATWDGEPLKDCKTTLRIKVYPMEVTNDGDKNEYTNDFHKLHHDLYDVFTGEERERGFEI